MRKTGETAVSHRKNVSSRILFSLTLLFFLLIAPAIYAELINDGSFENEPSAWEEFFSNACTPSGIGNWSSIPGGPPNVDGQQSLWVGGICNTNPPLFRNNGARQTISLADDAALLSFWFNPIKGTPDPLNLDRAFITMNGTEIWSLDVDGINNPTGWNNGIVDIDQFAGQSVTLSLAMQQNVDPSIANVFFDAIEVFHPNVTINQVISPTAVLEGDPFSVEITVENGGDTPLDNLIVTNTNFADCNQSSGNLPDLAPGESTNYSCQVSAATLNLVNAATATATTTAINYMVEANSTIDVTIINPLLTLTVNPDAVSINSGDQIAFALTLTNDGSTAFQNVQIGSNPAIGCNLSLDTFPIGQTAVFNCTHTPNQSGTILFTVTGEETVTNTEVYAETVVTIELIPVDPPVISNYSLHLPLMLNNYVSQSPLGEPNDSCGHAYPIPLNQQKSFLAEDIHDWYRFKLDTPGDINILLSNFAPIDGQITIWRGSCNNLTLLGQNGDFSATKNISLTNQPAATYYLWLINDGSTALTEKYNLTIASP
jgi:hypothetical protein